MTEKGKKGLETSKEVFKMASEHYMGAHEAKKQGKPVTWMTGYDPVEILYAMDVAVVYPENYSALCAVTQVAPKFIEAAERAGYSGDLCSYARNTIGTTLEEGAPLGGLASPDFLVVARKFCKTHIKWWQVLSRRFNCPLFIIDAPYVTGQVEDYHIDHYVSQLEDLIVFLEEQTGRKLDYDKLAEVVRLSDRASELWDEVMEMRKNVPCPVGAADILSCMFAIVTLPGTKAAVDFYERLRDEVKERVKKRMGVIPEEKYRLLWDNIVLWYNVGLSNYFHRFGAVFVLEPYTMVWSGRLDPQKPLESLARKYMSPFIELNNRAWSMVELCKQYKIDGAVMHSNRSCKFLSLLQYELKDILMEQLGIPSLIIEGDHCDGRAYSDAQVKMRIQAFMELLG
ncbi:MAG: 2-hydroxyacyl-CoA dehydratase subunit D [Candidatus Jordarchaeum sp.]|uniref:2-hydroxyacyl-CoA dehydratase subunit D n=1 Tax=Candidatus Jordarchaeum sp. TaxID=2823881 RepID=UPI004049E8F4